MAIDAIIVQRNFNDRSKWVNNLKSLAILIRAAVLITIEKVRVFEDQGATTGNSRPLLTFMDITLGIRQRLIEVVDS